MTSSLKETISLFDPPSCASTLNVPINKVTTSNKINPVPKEKSVFIADTLFLTTSIDVFITLFVLLTAGCVTTLSVVCLILEVFILFTT